MRDASSTDRLNAGCIPHLVRQKHLWGCQAAVFAMLIGCDYDEAAQILTDGDMSLVEEKGFGYFAVESQLVERGYAVARKYHVTQPGSKPRDPWPCAPFADVHWCEVLYAKEGRGAHAIVMLRDGSVLDPMHDEPRKLSDYYAINFVAGVYRVG